MRGGGVARLVYLTWSGKSWAPRRGVQFPTPPCYQAKKTPGIQSPGVLPIVIRAHQTSGAPTRSECLQYRNLATKSQVKTSA